MRVRVAVSDGSNGMTVVGYRWTRWVGRAMGEHIPPAAGNTLHHGGTLSPVLTRVCMQLKDCAIFPWGRRCAPLPASITAFLHTWLPVCSCGAVLTVLLSCALSLLSSYCSIVLSISVYLPSLHPVCLCLLACGVGCLSLLGYHSAELPSTFLSFPITCSLTIHGQQLPHLSAIPHPSVPIH